MQGLHLTADASGCDANTPAMREPAALRALCLAAVAQAGLTPVGELFHHFAPNVSDDPHAKPGGGGITGVVLLAESHLAVHTWPELGAVTLDVYVCNFGADNSAKAEGLMQALLAAWQPASVDRQRLQRGQGLPPSA
jgi:S-adenosylmethionine decarboxylase proenzyme